MTVPPIVTLIPGRQLDELLTNGRAQIVSGGADLEQVALPFTVHPASPPLPPGKVSFFLLTTGEFWIIAGGEGGVPLQFFAAVPG
jgi:hypothetical protein